jgi:hypothetical protein
LENHGTGEENIGGNELERGQPTVVISKGHDVDQNLMN